MPNSRKPVSRVAFFTQGPYGDFDVQRLSTHYVVMERSNFDGKGQELYNIIEVPLKASAAEFGRAVERALESRSFHEQRKMARVARKMACFDQLVGERRNDWRLRNLQSAIHATIRVKVAFGDVDIVAFWKNVEVHSSRIPYEGAEALVAQIHHAFDVAEKSRPTRFRQGASIDVLRTAEHYHFNTLCLVDEVLELDAWSKVPLESGDAALGAALLDAMTRLPRYTFAEYLREPHWYIESAVSLRSVRGSLYWPAVDAPGKLGFSLRASAGWLEPPKAVPDSASAATIGKLVRTVTATKIRKNRKGATNDVLLGQLSSAGFLEFSKRKANARKLILEKGWQACVDDEFGRCYHADSEDLAEGGVGKLLRELKPFFAQIGLKPGKVRDDFRESSYDVWIDKKCFPILVARDFARESSCPGHLWGIASHRAAGILGTLLKERGRNELAYSLEGGNDHHFIFLTPDMHAALTNAQGFEPRRGPYLSTGKYPSYGLPEF